MTPIVPYEGPWVDVVRRGEEVLLLGVGPETYLAEAAASMLESEGISTTVAAVTRVKPLDSGTILELIEGHQVVVTVEDNSLAGGFGSAVLELMADNDVERPIKRAGLPDAFVRHGAVDLLRRDVGLTVEQVADAARRALRVADQGWV